MEQKATNSPPDRRSDERFHYVKHRLAAVLAAIGGSSIALRYLLSSPDWRHTGLVYIAVPFAVGLCLLVLRPRKKGQGVFVRYGFLLMDSLIVMFMTSAFLFEGFLCVLFFMPIYFGIVSLVFLVDLYREKVVLRRRLYSFALPALVLVASLEGTTDELSFERENRVTSTRVVALSLDEIKANLARPFELGDSAAFLLRVFVMPSRIQAGSLQAGDVHTIDYDYCRWFVTNCHSGSMALEISSVSDRRIATRILHDDSYISHYLHLRGTEILLAPMPDGRTLVTLSVDFERRLDPAWYFGPLQRSAVTQMAGHLIDEIIAR